MKICIIALHAYPAIDSSAKGVFGGTETRAWTIAQGLAKVPGVEVTLIVRNSALKKTLLQDGVHIIPYNHSLHLTRYQLGECLSVVDSFPYISLRKWSWDLPWIVVKYLLIKLRYTQKIDPTKPDCFYTQIDTDCYCTFGVHSTSATVVASAKEKQKTAILFLGADSDLDENYQPDSNFRTQYHERANICYYALRHADLIVTQKEEQQALLQKRFHRKGYLFPNPIDLEAWQQQAVQKKKAWLQLLSESKAKSCPESYVLWVGRADNFHKRADLMLKVAQTLTEIPFLMIMNPRDYQVETEIYRNRPPNLYLLESVPYEIMPAAFAHAKCFVNTSSKMFEGFPNTFLQAACQGAKIISLETADEFLNKTQAGVSANGNLDELMKIIRETWKASRDNQAENRTKQMIRDLFDIGRLTQSFVYHLKNFINSV